ncbi:MAG: hypothetical protein U0232_20235 [Thermomicrobiales bacterium]
MSRTAVSTDTAGYGPAYGITGPITVRVEHQLIRRDRDQQRIPDRVVRHEDGHARRVADQRVRDLLGGERLPRPGVQDQVDRRARRGARDLPQHPLGRVKLVAAQQRQPEKPVGLAPRDQRDRARTARPGEPFQAPGAS